MTTSVEEKFKIVRSVGEECIQEDELINLLAKNSQPICYDRFEPCGRMNIAQGVMKTINVKKLTSAGCKVKILIADLFVKLNNKMGSDLEKIKIFGLYLIEIWKALGMNIEDGQVDFLWSSNEINSQTEEYWSLVLDIAQRNKLPRILRCAQIMGRNEQDELTAVQIFNQCMQCADIVFLKADICQMGMDQKEVNVLAREYCDDISIKSKPIILSHHMLPGLKQGQEKMSKSDPSSCIYMDDDEAEVNSKIKKAYCPPEIVEGNPCLEYAEFLIFPWFNEFKVERREKNGGAKTFTSFEELKADYESGNLHPGDFKPALSKTLNKILQPIRDHFKNDPTAKKLLEKVKGMLVRGNKVSKVSKRPPSNEIETLSISPKMTMSVEEKFKIVRSVGEECIQDDELMNLLSKKPLPISYDGFEPSGRMHIAQGVMKSISVNKLTSADCKVKIWIADWFAKLNNKMGGDLEKIKIVGQYLIEIWKAVGMNLENGKVDFLWSSKEINSRAEEYFPLVWDIAQRNTLSRILRCVQIMGRSEQDELTAAQIFYPCMQCADVFFLEADICQLGMDQRKVNVLAREYCDDIKRKNKPIILSHHMLPGLKQGQEKMSKSDPSSSIYMEDDEAEVNFKIDKAYCPPKIVEGNPCMDYVKFLIFPWFNDLKVERCGKNGGDKIFTSFEELRADYESGNLDPADFKSAISKSLNKILQPVRDHFKNDPTAKGLLEKVKGFAVTR